MLIIDTVAKPSINNTSIEKKNRLLINVNHHDDRILSHIIHVRQSVCYKHGCR